MGARKLTAVVEASARDNDLDGAFPLDDDLPPDEGEALGRVCLACGGDGHAHDGCAHGEIARLTAPSRAVEEAVVRLRRAAAEHRAAARALRVLVLTEVARERAELETSAPEAPAEPLPEPEVAAPLPCARCAERDAEAAAPAGGAPRAARKRARAAEGQQAFTFGASGTRE
jgi:hypothetical protein